ncbi:phage integrase Arm DNA-binding domain-containing protein [Cupriavidus sp. JZ107]
MAARPRIRKRAHFPPNLHEPRPGYYTWRNPLDGKTHVIGRVPLAQAIQEANEANAHAERVAPRRSLVQRMDMVPETMADLLGRMPKDDLAANTLRAHKAQDKAIVAALGEIRCGELTTKDVADFLEAIKAQGKLRWAQSLRSRLISACTKGVALGWMQTNPAQITEAPRVKVKRRRLTMDEFMTIYARAPEVSEWLQSAMMLALISGQDRVTIATLERSAVKDGMLQVVRPKTGVAIAIPLELRMDAVGKSLGEVVAECRATGVVSRYLIHHVRVWGNAPRGSKVHPDRITHAFSGARDLVGISGEDAPTFHEIRSLCKRIYVEQGNVDTKALLGHSTERMAALYENPRGIGPIKVRISAA